MPINTATELGSNIADSNKTAGDYKDGFIETELAGDIVLTGINAVDLATTIRVCQQDLNVHFTLDHPVNGELDSSVFELDTGLGGKVCPFYIVGDVTYDYWTEFFNFTTYKSTGTANWDTTSEVLRMSTNTSHFPPVSTYQDIGVISTYSVGTITNLVMNCSETRWNPTDIIRYFVSSDNKASWDEATLGSTLTLTTSGTQLYVRVVFVGNGNYDTYIDNLTLQFNV